MALQANKHYLGVRMGTTSAGLPLYAIHDPCDTGLVGRVGIPVGATSAGLPLYAHKGCGTASPVVNSTYAAVRMGATSAGFPLYAVPCVQCVQPPNFTLAVTGCNGSAVPGAAVEVYSGATLIASGTTDGSGLFQFYLPAAGTYRVVIARSRYATYDQSTALSGSSATRGLNPATGYRCINCCNFPAPETLYAHGWGGSAAIVYDAVYGGWVGTQPVSRMCATAYEVVNVFGDCRPAVTSSGTAVSTFTWRMASDCSLFCSGIVVQTSRFCTQFPNDPSCPTPNRVWLSDSAACVLADPGCSCPRPLNGVFQTLPGSGFITVVSCEPIELSGTLLNAFGFPAEPFTIKETP